MRDAWGYDVSQNFAEMKVEHFQKLNLPEAGERGNQARRPDNRMPSRRTTFQG